MNEAGWRGAADPRPLLAHLRATNLLSARKEQLFACACARRAWKLLVHEASRAVVLVAGRFADGLLKPAERKSAFEHAEAGPDRLGDSYHSDSLGPENEYDAAILAAGVHRLAIAAAAGCAACAIADGEADAAVGHAPDWAVEAAGWAAVQDGAAYEDEQAVAAERAAQAELLRHLVDGPFRALRAPACWPPAVHGLAEAVYRGADVAFALHDALVEHGLGEFAEDFRQREHPTGCAWLDAIPGRS